MLQGKDLRKEKNWGRVFLKFEYCKQKFGRNYVTVIKIIHGFLVF